jgi:hypothetical protein
MYDGGFGGSSMGNFNLCHHISKTTACTYQANEISSRLFRYKTIVHVGLWDRLQSRWTTMGQLCTLVVYTISGPGRQQGRTSCNGCSTGYYWNFATVISSFTRWSRNLQCPVRSRICRLRTKLYRDIASYRFERVG